jgi:hypothetical protein
MLLHKHQRDALAAQIKADIDEFCRVEYDGGFRNHLGASLIGHACNRYLWYTFRWVLSGQFKGRMQRLFNRGHETEPRFIHWLEGIGFKVWYEDDNGKQFRVSGVEQHFGGSLDGVSQPPSKYSLPPDFRFLTEFKTYNEQQFKKLVAAGSVKKAKPQHFAQMSEYGYKVGFKYALYCAICKNDDEIYIEIVELDMAMGAELERRAEYVITSANPPPRLSEDATYYECKFCDYWNICHKSGEYQKNCRSCAYAIPVEAGQWKCTAYNAIIPDDVIRVGCNGWRPVGRT